MQQPRPEAANKWPSGPVSCSTVAPAVIKKRPCGVGGNRTVAELASTYDHSSQRADRNRSHIETGQATP
jgi:hypothetical protein